MRKIKKPYKAAFPIPATFLLAFVVKKVTVKGIIGKTQGVSNAIKPPANQYSEKVDFVQIVKLKGKVKTSFSGSVEYQTCDDKKCLPPKTVNFKVALDQ